MLNGNRKTKTERKGYNMNRTEVIMTIKKVGNHFGRVMSVLCGDEYAAGYNRAVSDMVELFTNAPMDADFETERKALISQIKDLKKKNEELEHEVCEKHATIQKLLSHVNISEVLGVETKKQEEPKVKRRVAIFTFK